MSGTIAIPPKELLEATIGGLSVLVVSGGSTGNVLTKQSDGTYAPEAASSASGDVVGPASATDNAVARFDTTTGKRIQNSSVTIDDSGNVTCGNVKIGGSYQWLGNSTGFYFQTPSVANWVLLTPNGVQVSSSMRFTHNAGATGSGAVDLSWGRASAGVGAVYTTETGGTLAGFNAAAITASGLMCCGVYTFATVPSASSNTGKFLRISDRAQKHAYSDGTNWRFFGDDAIIS